MPEVLRPARLVYADDGTPWSDAYADVYHASAGGPGQARHVFLQGNQLPERWQRTERFTLLETGFGTGLNFLATWSTWRAARGSCARLHYIAAEKHPFSAADLAKLHARWPELAAESAALHAAWPTLTPGFHRLELDAGNVTLTLLLGDAVDTLPRLRARVDAFYLDGFSPAQNPELWSPELFRTLARLAAPEATLATWSVAGRVRESMRGAGFTVEKAPGYGNKREMLKGRYDPPLYRPVAPAPQPPVERRALVIGAGLAGTACCERLAARGWNSVLIDRHPGPAQEASGNHAGIFHPLLARDDNIPARLTRAAFLHGLRHWQRLNDSGHDFPWRADGLVQLARDPRHEDTQRRLLEELGYPADYARHVDAAETATLVGAAVPMGGWLVPRGGWAKPAGLCRAYLAQAGERVKTVYDQEVVQLRKSGHQWQAIAPDGSVIAEAAHVILASGSQAAASRPWVGDLAIERIRGQVTQLRQGSLPALIMPICREGYLTPNLDGWHCLGASYDTDADPMPRSRCDEENWARLVRLIKAAPIAPNLAESISRVGFRAVAADRLPLVGKLADPVASGAAAATQLRQLVRLDGLHSLLGYASRGIIWSSLMAELLVSGIEGEPLPLESDLVDAVDPGRFLLKRLRKNKGPD
jgi:tRNA 5-methylaminomethyl-2-thiouridine biosynthesis bifunctional protein